MKNWFENLIEKHHDLYLDVLNSKETYFFTSFLGENVSREKKEISTREELIVFSEALKINHQIKVLNVGDVELGEEGMKIISNFLKLNPNFIHIHFSGTFIGNGLKILIESLEHNSKIKLEELGLPRNILRDEEMTHLSNFLKSNSTLKKLDLEDNIFEKNGLDRLGQALSVNSTLTEIHLGFNYFIGKDLKFLKLKENSSLINLDLSNSSLGDIGFKILCEDLRFNSSLKVLNISGCDFGGKVLILLSQFLKVNCCLVELNMHGTEFKEDDMSSIIDSLKVNCSLTKFGFNFKIFSNKKIEKQILFLLNCNEGWSPEFHYLSNQIFKDSIFSFLLCLKRSNSKVTKFVLFEIIKKIDRKIYFEKWPN